MKIFGVLAALAAFFVPAQSQAQVQRCDDRQQLVDWLKSKHKETKVASGVTKHGALMEVFATADRSTWTILVSRPPLATCILTSGHGWQEFKQVVGEPS